MPELKIDATLKSFFGRGSGESFQMEFNGDGFVVISHTKKFPSRSKPVRKVLGRRAHTRGFGHARIPTPTRQRGTQQDGRVGVPRSRVGL